MEFVTFEIAKKLREKGFKDKCLATYNNCGEFEYNELESFEIESIVSTDSLLYSQNNVGSNFWTDAPTISQVLKWLREEKKIHIVIDITNYGFISSTISFKWDKSYCENEIEHYDHEGYSTYEEATIAGIEYVIDNLI